MSAGELLARIVAIFDESAVPFMVAGSFASTYYGVPRTTHDIDIVIAPTHDSLAALLTRLPETEYYADADVARDALNRSGQFNVIDMATGWKVDLIMRKSRPFSIAEFDRRQSATLLGVPVFVATIEDTVIAKLEWAKLGDSERQLRDVVGLLGVHRESIDLAYVQQWVDELQLAAQWQRVTAH
jgi:hypothetical protein